MSLYESNRKDEGYGNNFALSDLFKAKTCFVSKYLKVYSAAIFSRLLCLGQLNTLLVTQSLTFDSPNFLSKIADFLTSFLRVDPTPSLSSAF